MLIRYNSVSANYFTMMGTQIRQGRAFTIDDTESAPRVVVINETMARQYWPDGSAVGSTLRTTDAGAGDFVVVGIAQDGKYNSGLILSLIGLYSVVAFTVAQRTREIGLRMALGAQPGDIFRSVMAKSLTLAATGVSAGAGLGWLATRGLSQSVYGVNPADPGSFMATAVVLVLVSAAATWWPARRATLVDPVTAIRSE